MACCEPESLTGVRKGVEAQMIPCYYLMLHHKYIMEIILGSLLPWQSGPARTFSLELVSCQYED